MSTSDHENDTKEVAEANIRKIHENAAKIGYGDGVEAGQKKVFQQSFDRGYADGLRTGFELEKIRAFYNTIANKREVPSNLLEEARAYEQMNIPDTMESFHFRYNQHKEEPLDSISKHQHEYVDKHLSDFRDKLPQTNNLFS